jgi:copper resistance protein B
MKIRLRILFLTVAFVSVGLVINASSAAAQDMPGMNMPKAKTKAKPKQKAKTISKQKPKPSSKIKPKQAAKTTKAKPKAKPTEMNMPMDMPMPSPTQTPKTAPTQTPSPTPMQMDMNMPKPTVTPTPSEMEMNMPMPTATPTPKPSPTNMPMEMNMPTATPTPAPMPMEMNMPMPAPSPTPKPSSAGGETRTTLPNLSSNKDFGEPVADNEIYSFVLFDLLEYESNRGAGNLRWDMVGWRGTDYNRFWFKSEGRQSVGERTGEIELQALYGRLIAPYFDFQVGVRVDNRWRRGRNASRVLAVVGLQGLAQYRFEIEPALFISYKGDVSARLTATKDFLLTQKAILQGRFETNVAAQKVEKFGIGSGLNDVGLGLRLRYEIRREFAPYIGVSWSRSFGQTADFARREGEATNRLSIVGGARIWF